MKNLGKMVAAGILLASLSACGKTEDANQPAAADTVEMPADELPSGDPSMAAPPMEDAGAAAPAGDGTGAPDAADAAQAAAESAKAAAAEAGGGKAGAAPAAKSAEGR